MKKKVFRLFANCIPVRGVRRSVISDLQRNNVYYIPNDLYTIVTKFKDQTLDEIKGEYNYENNNVIDDYFGFLIENELGFWTSEWENFPDLSLEWDEPSIITNAVIDINSRSDHNFKLIFDELEAVGCMNIQLRFYDEIKPQELEQIICLLERRRITSVDLIIKYNKSFKPTYLRRLTDENLRINVVFVHSCSEDLVLKLSGDFNNSRGNIIYTRQIINSNSHCGLISPLYFTYNIKTFTEAQKYNSCLNRKVSIDVDGSIKNCPSLDVIYGNIKDNSISEFVYSEHFQSIWNINKDQVDTCKVCEHRYICTDCRAFLNNKEGKNIYSKPAKCSYNPYTAKWEN